ncbi:MAG: class I SAM-dependent methyltransferase [Candidatus Thorarchaeota archaeon]
MSKYSVFETPIQEIHLPLLPLRGLVIDVGGGSEGLVSRMEGSRVCAVDINFAKIREAMIHGSLSNWFTCDGQTLCFASHSFDIATLFFSLGYMRDHETKVRVLEEVYRVLKPDGLVYIKASRIDDDYDKLVFLADFILPDGTVSRIGYSVRGRQNQSIESIASILLKTGFEIIERKDNGYWFEITGSKSLKSRPNV